MPDATVAKETAAKRAAAKKTVAEKATTEKVAVRNLAAKDIELAHFSQVFHMPLVWQGDAAFDDAKFNAVINALKKHGWQKCPRPLDHAETQPDDAKAINTFSEFVYFHDFVREFLYPISDKPFYEEFELKTHTGISAVFDNEAGEHDFEIKRLVWRVFRSGIAMLCLEIAWRGKSGAKAFNLADAQTIIDHLRRSYTSYWFGAKPKGVPLSFRVLPYGPVQMPQNQREMTEKLKQNHERGIDADLLEPWRSWTAPFGFCDHTGSTTRCNWRDPSDERIPSMSYIAVKQKKNQMARDAILQIREGDWYRLAEADEANASGDTWFEYNANFLRNFAPVFFFDRFMPMADGKGQLLKDQPAEDELSPYYGTRQVFGGTHYAMVTVEKPDEPSFLRMHFANHYEKMALIVRYELTSLLGFSSRITRLVRQYDTQKNIKKHDFQQAMAALQDDFLSFTHRHRFTGVSSQIQPSEMYRHWQQSLGLDSIYQDVKAEIESAAGFAQSQIDSRANARASRVATIGTVLSIALGASVLMSTKLFNKVVDKIVSLCTIKNWSWGTAIVEFALLAIIIGLLLLLLGYIFKKIESK